MENASKALIIAGAILLSILIVSLGIMVFQNAKNTVGSSNLNKQEIESFNSQWQSYEGKKQTASQVKAMVQAVIASNASETKGGTNRWINVKKDTTVPTDAVAAPTSGDVVKSVPSPSNSGTYTITCCYGTDGLITAIYWSQNNT